MTLLGSSRTQPWDLGNAHRFSVRDQVTHDGEPFAHAGAKDLHQPHWGTDPWLPVPSRKKKDPRANERETELGTPRQLRGGQTGRQMRRRKESLELGKCRGLLQGLLAGLTLAPALEMQVGTMGQAWAIPSLGPPKFPELRAGILQAAVGPHSASLGTSEASARQMGHVRLAFNHLSTHLAWNSWLQGRTRSSCRTSKSLKQTTHSICSD